MKDFTIIEIDKPEKSQMDECKKGECAFCQEDKILIDHCPKSILDHRICQECIQHINLNYYKNRQAKRCIYCGDRPTTPPKARQDRVHPHIEQNIQHSRENRLAREITNRGPGWGMAEVGTVEKISRLVQFIASIIFFGVVVVVMSILFDLYRCGWLYIQSERCDLANEMSQFNLIKAWFGSLITVSLLCCLTVILYCSGYIKAGI